jgi:hypothetical protein
MSKPRISHIKPFLLNQILTAPRVFPDRQRPLVKRLASRQLSNRRILRRFLSGIAQIVESKGQRRENNMPSTAERAQPLYEEEILLDENALAQDLKFSFLSISLP